MSILRFGEDSDVYMYEVKPGVIECSHCKLHDHASQSLEGYEAAFNHLKEHRGAGHKVPEAALQELTRAAGLNMISCDASHMCHVSSDCNHKKPHKARDCEETVAPTACPYHDSRCEEAEEESGESDEKAQGTEDKPPALNL